MKIYILIDWDINHIVGAYADKEEAEADKDRFIKTNDLHVIERDLIEVNK